MVIDRRNASLSDNPDVFSAFYVSMLRVGEATGMLEEVFLRLFYYLEFEKSTRDQIKAAINGAWTLRRAIPEASRAMARTKPHQERRELKRRLYRYDVA